MHGHTSPASVQVMLKQSFYPSPQEVFRQTSAGTFRNLCSRPRQTIVVNSPDANIICPRNDAFGKSKISAITIAPLRVGIKPKCAARHINPLFTLAISPPT